jgi:hypothetical protein
MIDVNTETLVTFSQLAGRHPHRRNGRPTHVSTIHRWRLVGIRGVRLEAIRSGGAWVSSLEAYARFCAALTVQAGEADPIGVPAPLRPVDDALDALGL